MAYKSEIRLAGESAIRNLTEIHAIDMADRECGYRAGAAYHRNATQQETEMTQFNPIQAREILARAHIALGTDYHTLRPEAVEVLIAAAKTYRYRKPRKANGSTGRYFHDYLQRRAAHCPTPSKAPDAVMSAMETETDPLPDAVAAAWDTELNPPPKPSRARPSYNLTQERYEQAWRERRRLR